MFSTVIDICNYHINISLKHPLTSSLWLNCFPIRFWDATSLCLFYVSLYVSTSLFLFYHSLSCHSNLVIRLSVLIWTCCCWSLCIRSLSRPLTLIVSELWYSAVLSNTPPVLACRHLLKLGCESIKLRFTPISSLTEILASSIVKCARLQYYYPQIFHRPIPHFIHCFSAAAFKLNTFFQMCVCVTVQWDLGSKCN